MKRNIFGSLVLIIGGLFFIGETSSSAAETTLENKVVYSTTNKTQESIKYIDEDGEQVTLTIEIIPPFLRVSNGTHKITKSYTGVVSISYNVSVSNNSITSANSLSAIAAMGTVQSKSLNRISSSKAVATVTVKPTTLSVTKTLTAEISNNQLIAY